MPAARQSRQIAELIDQRESLGDLLTDLAGHSAGLVQDEFMLARQEITEKIKLYKTATFLLAIGAVIGFMAILTLCATFVIWLSQYIEPWLAAGITGLGLVVISTLILLIARNELGKLSLKPEQTIRTLEENKEWLKDMS